MKVVSVSQLQSDPSGALRDARVRPVVVLNGHQPEALLVHLGDDSLLGEPGVRLALAVALYKDEGLPLGRAAEFLRAGAGGLHRAGLSIGHTGGAGREHRTRGHGGA